MSDLGKLNTTLATTPQAGALKQKKPEVQTKQELTPVKSSLPAMNQMASATQMSQATQDNRFKQALTQKYQADLKSQQQKLGAAQEEFNKQKQAAPQIADQSRIADLIKRINVKAETEEQVADVANATAEYQQLMSQQAPVIAEPEELKRARANLMALSRLSGAGAGGLASAYAVGPVGASTMAMQQQDGNVSNVLFQAKKAALDAQRQAAISDQELALEQAKAAQLRGLSTTQAGAEQSKFLRDLEATAKGYSAEKDAALNELKNAILFGGTLNEDQIKKMETKLGLTRRDLSEMSGIDLGQISGFEGVTDLSGLEAKVKQLTEGTAELSDEQKRFLDYYKNLGGYLTRSSDAAGQYAAATPEQLARINALRRLTGQGDVTAESIGGAEKASSLGQLESLKGEMEGAKATSQERASYQQRISDLDKLLSSKVVLGSDMGGYTKRMVERYGDLGQEYKNRLYGFYNKIKNKYPEQEAMRMAKKSLMDEINAERNKLSNESLTKTDIFGGKKLI